MSDRAPQHLDPEKVGAEQKPEPPVLAEGAPISVHGIARLRTRFPGESDVYFAEKLALADRLLETARNNGFLTEPEQPTGQ